jgi:hypothetical protein
MIQTLIAAISAILALIGALFYQTSKRKSAEALLLNNNIRDQINKSNVQIAQDQGLLKAQEDKQKALEAEQTSQKETNDSLKDLTDFINSK